MAIFPISPQLEENWNSWRQVLINALSGGGGFKAPSHFAPGEPNLPEIIANLMIEKTPQGAMQSGIISMGGPFAMTKIRKPISSKNWMDKPRIYYRIQPPGMDLSHKSLSSIDKEINGIFVFDSKPSKSYITGEWLPEYYEGKEMVKIKAFPKDTFDAGDYEGIALRPGKGEIIDRIPWDFLRGWFLKSAK